MGTCVTNKMAFVMVACADCLHSATAAKATNRKLRWMAADMSLDAMFTDWRVKQVRRQWFQSRGGLQIPNDCSISGAMCPASWQQRNNVRGRYIFCVRNT